jgi:hypothetical protein
MNKSLLKLKAAHENFRAVQNKLLKFGASDTEPDTKYEMNFRLALYGLPFKPLTAEEWQLYTCSMKCHMAARRLNSALQKVANVLVTMKMAERPEIMEWVKTWAWRVDMDWNDRPKSVSLPTGHKWQGTPSTTSSETSFRCKCGATFEHDMIDNSQLFEDGDGTCDGN